jgi:hypothetical protein
MGCMKSQLHKKDKNDTMSMGDGPKGESKFKENI